MYALALTSFATLSSDERKWLRVVAPGLAILPLLFAFGTANRGTLIAFVAGMLVFVFGQRKRRFVAAGAVLVIVAYYAVLQYFPVLVTRFTNEGDSGHLETWASALQWPSVFGRGYDPEYPHNIFLECQLDYGIVGLLLFVFALVQTVKYDWTLYLKTKDQEVLWVIALFVMQMTAQQMALNIFFAGALWATFALAITMGCEEEANEPFRVS
jgi:O-antigen ligase